MPQSNCRKQGQAVPRCAVVTYRSFLAEKHQGSKDSEKYLDPLPATTQK